MTLYLKNWGIKKMENKKHAGGRPATGIKRVSINISGKPEQMDFIKSAAKSLNMTVSELVHTAVKSYYELSEKVDTKK
jgi:hypothetical protein